jgi:transcriptional regulator with XRE-family HTH domain
MTETFGQALRRLRGSRSLRAVAHLAHCSKSYVGDLESDRKTPSRAIAAALDRAVNAQGDLLALAVDKDTPQAEQMKPSSQTEEATKRRDAVKLAGLAMASPAVAAEILNQAAAEALDFTRQAEATALGTSTLDHLDLAVTEFNDAYSLKPPQKLFDGVLDYRR